MKFKDIDFSKIKLEGQIRYKPGKKAMYMIVCGCGESYVADIELEKTEIKCKCGNVYEIE